MTTLTGREFNLRYAGTEFYKILNWDNNHHGFQYKDGLNIDTNPFKPEGHCHKGGLFFTEADCLSYWLYLGIYICKATVPDDAQVYIDKYKFKADRLYVDFKSKVPLYQFPFTIQHICQSADTLKYVHAELQTDAMCLAAVQHHGYALEHVYMQTEDLCLAAVKQNGYALQHVYKRLQTAAMCLAAVRQNGLSLQYVNKRWKTQDLCLAAVQQDGRALQFVKKGWKTDELCRFALKQQSL